MGIAEEMISEEISRQADEDFKNWNEETLFRNKEWETRNNKVLKIKEMGTEHILNTMKLIKSKNFKWRGKFYKLFEEELLRRHRI